MSRKRLPRKVVKCARPGCHNTFEIAVGGKARKNQRKYRSLKCAAQVNAKKRKRNSKKNKVKGLTEEDKRKFAQRKIEISRPPVPVYSVSDLQDLPVNLGHSGGKFAEVCNKILKGEAVYIGPQH